MVRLEHLGICGIFVADFPATFVGDADEQEEGAEQDRRWEETMSPSQILEFALTVGAIIVVVVPAVGLATRLLPKSALGGKERLADEARRVEELERRVGELEAGQRRVAELEERVDFAERLLAQQRDAPRVGPAKT